MIKFLLQLIMVRAIPFINRYFTFIRISTILFLYAGVLNLNTFYIQSIGSGIAIYSGLFQITQLSDSLYFIIESESLNFSIELQSLGLYVLSTLSKDFSFSNKIGFKNYSTDSKKHHKNTYTKINSSLWLKIIKFYKIKKMNKLVGYIKKYDIQTVVTVMTADGYRRQVLNDIANKEKMIKNIEVKLSNENSIEEFSKEYKNLSLDEMRNQQEALKMYLKDTYNLNLERLALEIDNHIFIEEKKLFYKEKEKFEAEKVYLSTNLKFYTEAWYSSKEKDNNITTNNDSKIEENKIETEKDTIQKVKSIQKELDNITKSDIGDVFRVAYNKYYEFLDTLSPDKIVCLFNIFIGSMTLSSFFTVLSIMLSENIINRISFLDKYPRILKLLRLRNNINRKIIKFYLLTHVVVILWGLIANIYMFSL